MAPTDSKIEDFAEQLGRLLGTAEAEARGWLGQREQIAKTLEGVRDTATKLLSDLGHHASRAVSRGRPVRKRGPGRSESDRHDRAAEAANDVSEGACGDFSCSESALGEAEGCRKGEKEEVGAPPKGIGAVR